MLCVKNEPMDVTLSGTGRLQLEPMCKAYGSRMFIQSHATIVSNHTGRDMIPPISLEYDCSNSMSKNFKLNRLRLQIPLGNVAGSFDDLKVANHKADVERLIYEQDWNVKHFTVDTHMSFLSYVGMMTTGLTLISFCYCCCYNVAAKDTLNSQNGGRTITPVPLLYLTIGSSLRSIPLEKMYGVPNLELVVEIDGL